MRLLIAGTALLGLAGAASAADLPVRPREAAPALVPAFNWTGLYVGAYGGYRWGDMEARVGDTCCVVFPLDLANGVFPRNISSRHDGPLGGGQVGFNLQIARFVAGIEADASWIDALAGAAYSAPDPNMPGRPITNSTFASKLDWLATIRGRAGILFGRALAYATGGVAFGDVENRVTAAIPAYDYAPPAWTGRRIEWGWAAGGGVEYALTQNISLKAEYLHYDLGERTIRASDPSTFPSSEHIDYALSTSGNIARAGVNFRF